MVDLLPGVEAGVCDRVGGGVNLLDAKLTATEGAGAWGNLRFDLEA
jgi:hypothetical protein